MTGSATKQSIILKKKEWIASWSLSSGTHSHDPLARNDEEAHFLILAALIRPSLARSTSSKGEGAGNAGCLAAPAASRANEKKHTSIVTTGAPKHRHSLRNGFNGCFVLSPEYRAC